MVSRNDGSNLQAVYLQPPQHRGQMRTDGSISTDYLQPSRVRTDGTISTDYLQNRVRNDNIPCDFRARDDGLSSHYLPAPQSGHRMSGDYLPTPQTMVHDVPFEESSLMVDYDALDSHDFIVPDDVSSPSPAEDIAEMDRQTKYYVSDRHYAGSGVSTPVLDSSDNDLMQEQLLQQQQLQQQQQQRLNEVSQQQQLHRQEHQEQEQRLDQQPEQQRPEDVTSKDQLQQPLPQPPVQQLQSVQHNQGAECARQLVSEKGEQLHMQQVIQQHEPQQVEKHQQLLQQEQKQLQQEQQQLQHNSLEDIKREVEEPVRGIHK